MYTGKSSKSKARHQSGMTLLEVIMAFSVLLIGLLSLFKVVTVASSSNMRTRQLQTALTKAQDVLELMKEVPTQTIACLASGVEASGCYSSCINAGAQPETCSVALGTDLTWYEDGHGIQFVPTITGATGTEPNTYEIQVVISWMGTERVPKTHRMLLRTMVYRQ